MRLFTPREFRESRIIAATAGPKDLSRSSYGYAAKSRRIIRPGVTTRGINLGPDSIEPATMLRIAGGQIVDTPSIPFPSHFTFDINKRFSSMREMYVENK